MADLRSILEQANEAARAAELLIPEDPRAAFLSDKYFNDEGQFLQREDAQPDTITLSLNDPYVRRSLTFWLLHHSDPEIVAAVELRMEQLAEEEAQSEHSTLD